MGIIQIVMWSLAAAIGLALLVQARRLLQETTSVYGRVTNISRHAWRTYVTIVPTVKLAKEEERSVLYQFHPLVLVCDDERIAKQLRIGQCYKLKVNHLALAMSEPIRCVGVTPVEEQEIPGPPRAKAPVVPLRSTNRMP